MRCRHEDELWRGTSFKSFSYFHLSRKSFYRTKQLRALGTCSADVLIQLFSDTTSMNLLLAAGRDLLSFNLHHPAAKLAVEEPLSPINSPEFHQ